MLPFLWKFPLFCGNSFFLVSCGFCGSYGNFMEFYPFVEKMWGNVKKPKILRFLCGYLILFVNLSLLLGYYKFFLIILASPQMISSVLDVVTSVEFWKSLRLIKIQIIFCRIVLFKHLQFLFVTFIFTTF